MCAETHTFTHDTCAQLQWVAVYVANPHVVIVCYNHDAALAVLVSSTEQGRARLGGRCNAL